MNSCTCSFIGLGLIGGSIARAFRFVFPDMKIKVFDKDIPSLSLALKEHIATDIYTELSSDLCKADYIFLCAPVAENEKNLIAIQSFLSKETIITDVGSVKTGIHKLIEEIGLEAQFIGGHPMTGSERYGFANSKANLLENAYYILTPTKKVSAERLNTFKDMITKIKAVPLVIDCKEHDYATAAISHLPHIIASGLVNLVKQSDSKEELMKTIAAGGFKDLTRIASSNPTIWQQICLTNTDNILQLLDDYITTLQQMKDKLSNSDAYALYNFFDEARIYRDSFNGALKGPLMPIYTITIEISDKPGSLAEVTAILAQNQLSIKNMHITHNREAEFGALSVEFYTNEDMLKAVEVLQKEAFTTYLKKN